MRRAVATSILALIVLLLTACGADEAPVATDDEPAPPPTPIEEAEPEPQLLVAAKLPPLADLVATVAGERAEVVSLIPAGVDSHTYEPRPSEARMLTDADVFIANGLDLNDAALRLAEANLPDGAPIYRVAEMVAGEDDLIYDHVHDHDHEHDHDHPHDDEDAAPNPHLWLSVAFAIDYVDAVADALSEVDPAGEDDYRGNAARYQAELEALDAAVADAVASIPEDNRKLVTYHDSWSYFGPRYDIEVIATIQPADFAEPSVAEVIAIIDQIREHQVPAVFGSEEFPSSVLESIAEETGATYIGDLSDDALPGEEGDPEHSYVGLMVANVDRIVDALGGDTSTLDVVRPAPAR
jgi:ABC-type Zn uptake system ZnuABC Zn-binding protein ZnuA